MAEATPTDEELAAQAGFTVAFFRSNSELWSIFKTALAEDYAPDRLLMSLRNSDWFKSTSQTQREAILLKSSDPAEFKRRAGQMLTHVQQIARDVGIPLGKATGQSLASLALMMGYTDEQIRRALGEYGSVFEYAKQGKSLSGETGAAQARINQALEAYGVTVTRNSIGSWVSGIAQGAFDENFVMNEIKRVAKSAYPGLAERIDAGETVRDIAQPYMEVMGELLEVNPQTLSTRDRTIRNALSQKTKEGYVSQTLPDFEVALRKDPRWNKTTNAREGMMKTALDIFNKMGVVA